jgi:hypothetical protein
MVPIEPTSSFLAIRTPISRVNILVDVYNRCNDAGLPNLSLLREAENSQGGATTSRRKASGYPFVTAIVTQPTHLGTGPIWFCRRPVDATQSPEGSEALAWGA